MTHSSTEQQQQHPMVPKGSATNVEEFKDMSENATREWVPPMLRKSRAIPLAICCLVFVVCLEIFDLEVRRNDGLPADAHHANTVRAARYLPTVGVIALGFVWKALASDVKKITPWSSMSGKWSQSSHSMLLDYTTNIEFTSIVKAARRKHGALFIALVVGFLCGALAALANALTRLDLFALTSTSTTFQKTSHFSFDQTLALPNDTLAIPYNHLGARPYAAVASERLPNGQFSSWTKHGYAFDSFAGNASVLPNSTIEATVQSFQADFSCYPLEFSTGGTPLYKTLKADASGIPELNCTQPIAQLFNTTSATSVIGNFKAWLNVSSCSEDTNQTFIIANAIKLKPVGKKDVNITSSRGLICAPKFSVLDAVVRANATTGEVVSYWPNISTTTNVDIGASMQAIWLYLNNPLDAKIQKIFSLTEINFTEDEMPKTDWKHFRYAISRFLGLYDTDPFFSLLTNGQTELLIDEYIENPDKFQSDAESLGNHIMAQVVSAFARKDISSEVTGSLLTRGPRIFLRQIPLRALQLVLVLIACASLLYATFLRPKTVLHEDPGSIAAAAVVLSASDMQVEKTFAHEAVSTESHMNQYLQPLSWQLHASTGHAVALRCQQPVGDMASATPNSPKVRKHTGWRPVPLLLTSRVAIFVALIGTIVALAILLKISLVRNGLCENTNVNSNAFALAPTAILVLLGYACSGIDGSIRTISSYKSLWKGSKKQAVLFNLSDVPRVVAPFRTTRVHSGISLTASSIVILLIPVIKIVTAGLYSVTLSKSTRQILPSVDTSLITHLESAYSLLNDSDSNVQRASQFAEWSRTPSFNVPRRSGILDNLVFSNLTGVEHGLEALDLSEAQINLTVPAIAVDVECATADMGIRGGKRYAATDCWTFSVACRSDDCEKKFYLSSILSGHYRRHGGTTSFTGDYCMLNQKRFEGQTYLSSALEFQVILVNYTDTSVMGSFDDTADDVDIEYPGINDTRWLDPGFLNNSVPRVRAVSCAATFNRVDVNTTYTRSTDSTWNPSSYDKASVQYRQEYNKSAIPNWLVPYAKYYEGIPNLADASSETPGLLSSNESLWPTRASSTNFFELLAAYADYELGNLTALMEESNFVAANKAMFEAYSTEILTELRPFALKSASGDNESPQAVDATLTFSQSRIIQDERTTIALEVLLAIITCCFAWVFARFPSQSILPKSPGSIAARMSFLAQSRLVQRLRDEKVARVADSQLWKEKCGLGWWPKADGTWDSEAEDGNFESNSENSGSEDEHSRSGEGYSSVEGEWRSNIRWGVDVGEDVVRASWKHRPSQGSKPPSIDEPAS
ncbi:uncharacterized protein K452DRAFT_307505 [Aplosporella prunicola CBS 121167]|uniref:C2H2-type domain-containing protein n=1 Tax=Aplosporella prunicola CBS 121167 TaxID=1176127 RepID=A0A6A6BGS6_9PEZI|nr:uncharacterized protein K452DRAFT_307505 [Aplosporella prunicola CBS 121167]KAF2143362.1 hypothetical protein K452DRAFT_307505 [Aplosporella prunicola CBS 121167]